MSRDIADDLDRAAANLKAARLSLTNATEVAQGAAWVAAQSGQSEQSIADALGVNRLTVRKWIGK